MTGSWITDRTTSSHSSTHNRDGDEEEDRTLGLGHGEEGRPGGVVKNTAFESGSKFRAGVARRVARSAWAAELWAARDDDATGMFHSSTEGCISWDEREQTAREWEAKALFGGEE